MAKVKQTEWKYKFITIKNLNNEQFEGRTVYRIFDKEDVQLGIISFYKPWKKYVFSSRSKCVFDAKCLADILDFMNSHR
jgi:hypothetical protein